MNRFDHWAFKYVLYSFPFVIVLLIWGSLGNPTELSLSKGMTRITWDTLGWIFMSWVLVSFILTAKMVISKSFRDSCLKKFIRIRERDERESLIAGDAAKFSLLSTLAILFLFLFLSLFHVSIGRHPETKVMNDKRGYISMGMNLTPFATQRSEQTEQPEGEEFFNYAGIPLSTSMLLLLLIFWQIASYHLFIRKEKV